MTLQDTVSQFHLTKGFTVQDFLVRKTLFVRRPAHTCGRSEVLCVRWHAFQYTRRDDGSMQAVTEVIPLA